MAKLEFQCDKWNGEGTQHLEFSLPNGHTFTIDVSNDEVVIHGTMCIEAEETSAANRVVVKIGTA